MSGPGDGPGDQGETMKIYLLMLLIGTIATVSHLNFERKSPEHRI
jgi:hypothetical protein